MKTNLLHLLVISAENNTLFHHSTLLCIIKYSLQHYIYIALMPQILVEFLTHFRQRWAHGVWQDLLFFLAKISVELLPWEMLVHSQNVVVDTERVRYLWCNLKICCRLNKNTLREGSRRLRKIKVPWGNKKDWNKRLNWGGIREQMDRKKMWKSWVDLKRRGFLGHKK